MKHLKEYDQFLNEGLFSKPNAYDPVIKSLIDRISEIFDIENLTFQSGGGGYLFTYDLEETGAISGHIIIKSTKEFTFDYYNYCLKVDDKSIDCSESMRKKIWKFFNNKWKERECLRKQAEINDFKKKYSL